MANPNIPQGTLNRVKASVTLDSFPELNVTPPYLGKEMITLGFEGEITTFVSTTTGVVTSPEPYQKATLTIHLLKTQALAPAYKAQLESSSLLGNVTVWPDVQTGVGITNYPLSNCAIQSVNPLNFNGTDAGWVVVIGGIYFTNSGLFL